jgi:tRNA nucleotidyltransferase (CCA-adding enzyme)
LTPESELPSHRGHETSGLKPVKQVCDRLGVPSAYRELALKVCEFHLHGHRIRELRPETILKVLEKLDAFRKPERIEKFVNSCLADKRGRTGHETESRETLDLLHLFHEAALSVDGGVIAGRLISDSAEGKQDGKRIRQAIQKERIRVIGDCRKSLGF